MLTAEVYPTELKSTGSGWATGIGKVACILSPATAGIIMHTTNSMSIIYLYSSGIMIVAGLSALLLRESKVL